MKKRLIALASILMLTGCATKSFNNKGVIVNIIEPPQQRVDSLQCNDKDFVMSYVYVGADSVKGKISRSEKRLIASYAKSALKETSYITPVGNKYMPGYDDKMYPIMTIDVIKSEIKKLRPREDIVEKKGYFVAQIEIKAPGSSVVCSSSKPISVEISYKAPTYNTSSLPSNESLKELLVKKAVKKAVASLVPVTETVFRQVVDGMGVVGDSAKMLNANNCEMAKEILENFVKENKDNDKAFYNLGVSYECLAKSCEVSESFALLKKALKAYTNAVRFDPSNELYNQARKDVNNQLKILKKVLRHSKDVKSYIKNFE